MKYIIGVDQESSLVRKLCDYLENRSISTEIMKENNWASVALKVAYKDTAQEYHEAVLMCSSGTGMSIAANKVKGCRAALCTSPLMSQYAKFYNHANILIIPIEEMNEEKMIKIVESWLETPYGNGEVGIAIDVLRMFEGK